MRDFWSCAWRDPDGREYTGVMMSPHLCPLKGEKSEDVAVPSWREEPTVRAKLLSDLERMFVTGFSFI